jgi:protein involved in polysaccharide export with SLBB domain
MHKKLLLIFLFFTISFNFFGQDIFKNQDLSNYRVEDLTDIQISKIKMEMSSKGLTMQDLEILASSKGMNTTQIALLKEKLNLSKDQELMVEKNAAVKTDQKANPTPETAQLAPLNNRIFGSEIFSNKNLNFEPNQSLATPAGYILGPGDELEIILFGMQQFQQTAKVSKEGFIPIPNVGNVKVGGLQFGAALELLKKKCGVIYSSLRSGASELSVSLTDFKTIQVTIIGARSPGNYSVSSLSTVFNALHAAGGPSENGSYRNIELIRKGKVIKYVDLYAFLTKGDVTGNLNLQNEDIIRVPPYQNRIEISGEVKRPGIFELKQNERYKDLLIFCSGYTDGAYHGAVTVTRVAEKKRKIVTFNQNELDTLELESGDVIRIDHILNLYENRISIKGAVNHPGEYELSQNMRISDLILKADGFREDAHLNRAILVREGQDLLKEMVGLDLREVLNNPGSSNNYLLKKEDELIVPSSFEFEEISSVEVNGEVLNPGQFPYVRKMRLYDLIIQSGGLKESAADLVEISRVTNSDANELTIESELISLKVNNDFSIDSSNIELMPFDIISVRKKSNYNPVNSVYVDGEAVYPGKYAIGDKNERIFSVIERAGGLNDRANPKGVKIIRIIDYLDTTSKLKKKEITVPIDYVKISRNQKHKSNVHIIPGDKIIVERMTQTVKVIGEIELNSEFSKVGNKRAKYYINSAGGFKEEADKRRVYVVYANGFAKKTKKFLFFKIYPKAGNGSQIVVTQKAANRNKISSGEVIGISSVLSSITGMTIALINLLQP